MTEHPQLPLFLSKRPGVPWPITHQQKILEVLQFAAEELKTPIQLLKHRSNTQGIVRPRHLAMWLMANLTAASANDIGKVFGGYHHSTVLYGLARIERARRQDVDLDRWIQDATIRFKNGKSPCPATT